MNSDRMDSDLVEEIDEMASTLAKSGFFSSDEILEILEDEFMEEEVDFSSFAVPQFDSANANFAKLEEAFSALALENVVAIHNCGYDIEEGVADAFELFVHLKNNKFDPDGFCFYAFEDVEQVIYDDALKITFGDFENDEKKALEIGNIVEKCLKSAGFDINWDGTLNNQIEIVSFKWDKSYDSEKEYEIEGAYRNFCEVLK
jgi:hypothetical protein